jgi:hypothetical protein
VYFSFGWPILQAIVDYFIVDFSVGWPTLNDLVDHFFVDFSVGSTNSK